MADEVRNHTGLAIERNENRIGGELCTRERLQPQRRHSPAGGCQLPDAAIDEIEAGQEAAHGDGGRGRQLTKAKRGGDERDPSAWSLACSDGAGGERGERSRQAVQRIVRERRVPPFDEKVPDCFGSGNHQPRGEPWAPSQPFAKRIDFVRRRSDGQHHLPAGFEERRGRETHGVGGQAVDAAADPGRRKPGGKGQAQILGQHRPVTLPIEAVCEELVARRGAADRRQPDREAEDVGGDSAPGEEGHVGRQRGCPIEAPRRNPRGERRSTAGLPPRIHARGPVHRQTRTSGGKVYGLLQERLQLGARPHQDSAFWELFIVR